MAVLAECPTCHRKQAAKNKLCSCGEELVKAKRSKKVKYWISYRLPDGKQKREYVGAFKDLSGYSIEDANRAHSKRVVQKAENRLLDVKSDTRMTFRELTEWYLGLEKFKTLSSYWRVKLSLEKFNSKFGHMIVSTVKPNDLENYQPKRKAEGLADNTVDHEIGTAKSMIYKAFDNDLVSGDTLKTFKVVKKLLKRNSNARNKILPREQFDKLMEHLPRHTKPIVSTAYYTGMRLGEILNLTWDKVDLKKRIICLEASDTKDKEPRTIPICEELFKDLTAIPVSIHTAHIFLYKSKPVKSISRSFRRACERANIPYGRSTKDGFVFHDLRRTFNTNMRKAGVAESVIMEITGHSTREMFDRYNVVDLEDAKEALNQLQDYLANVDQTVDQVAKSEYAKEKGGM